MYAELRDYLLVYKKLSLPGVGTLFLERHTASIDFINREVRAPRYVISFQKEILPVHAGFFAWLGARLAITEREAVLRFNDFAFDLKRLLSVGGQLQWDRVGTLQGEDNGVIHFNAAGTLTANPVPAVKVIREKAEHMVRVGEDQRSSAEMEQMLSHKDVRKNYWWAYALAIGLLAIMFIGWYLSEKGLSLQATGNNQRHTPVEAGATYRILP